MRQTERKIDRQTSKALVIIPYFGNFPNYFPLFLNSAARQSGTLDFLIITDNDINVKKYKNISVKKMCFSNLKKLILNKFDFPISLDGPYKLCDFKPAYGYIFDDFIEYTYEYWGICDCDVIFGDMAKYLNNFWGKYDRIGNLGHFQLYRNNEDMKTLFKKIGRTKFQNYRYVFSKSNIFGFDEQYGIGEITIDNDVSIAYFNDKIADVIPRIKNFTVGDDDPHINNYFQYKKGVLTRINADGYKKEYAYIHLQKRRMLYKGQESDSFCIVANEFLFEKDCVDILNNYNAVEIH